MTKFPIRTFKYRLLPTKKQHRALEQILESQRILYNAALQERVDCYTKTGNGRTFRDQCKALTELRGTAEFSTIPVSIQRWTLSRTRDAFEGFFRRCKSGGAAGFPRYKGRNRWRSFGFVEFSGITLRDGRIRFAGLPSSVRLHLHRPLPDRDLVCCAFTRGAEGWHVCLQYRMYVKDTLFTGTGVGIDVGLTHLATLSSGEHVPNPRIAKRAARELRRRQRALARCKRGSKRRNKVRLALSLCNTGISNARRTYLHQVSAKLVREHDILAMEKLKINTMSQGRFSKGIYDAGWALLKEMIAYKAEDAGKHLIEVDPKNTSQACSGCGAIVPKKLSERWHCCPHCGLEMDRDVNAARNVLRLAVLRQGLPNVAGYGERATGNLKAKGISQ